MNTTNITWWAVTIQKEDGHDIDAAFMTCSEEVINKFCKQVKPHMVCRSAWPSAEECLDFIEELAQHGYNGSAG